LTSQRATPGTLVSPTLRMALLNGIEAPVKRHLAAGGSPNIVDQAGRPLLWLAAARGHSGLCRVLVDAGADPQAVATEGTSILEAAKLSGCRDTLEYLEGAIGRLCPPRTSAADEPDPEGNNSFEVGPMLGIQREGVVSRESSVLGDDRDGAGHALLWEEEVVTTLPGLDDGECTLAATTIQSRITCSKVTEVNTDWEDVEIIFPTVKRGRVSFGGLNERFLRQVAGMLTSGFIDGSVHEAWLKSACESYEGDFQEGDVETRLRMLLGEHGVAVVDQSWIVPSPPAPDADPEELGEEDLAFLSCLGRDRYQELEPFYRNLQHYPLLTEEEERAAGIRWINCGDEAGVQALVSGNIRFVFAEAKKFFDDRLEFGDIVGEGILGLYEGSRRYDPCRENRFLTYAAWWVRQSILRALSSYGNGIRYPYKLGTALARFRWVLQREERRNGNPTAPADLAGKGIYPLAEAEFLHRIHQFTTVIPLDEFFGEPKRDLASTVFDPFSACQARQDDMLLRKALSHLSTKERDILVRHFGIGGRREETLEEIGQSMQPPISRERVRQLEARALERIQKRFPELRMQLEDQRAVAWPTEPLCTKQEPDDEFE